MRCAIYIRMSQKERQKDSFMSQRDSLIKYVTEKGWGIHDIYVDGGSGKSANRSTIQRMLEDSREKKFDAILTKDLSRLTRNKKLSNQIFNVATSNKIQIITIDRVCLNEKKFDRLIDDYYHHSKVTATSHDERNVLA